MVKKYLKYSAKRKKNSLYYVRNKIDDNQIIITQLFDHEGTKKSSLVIQIL